MTSVTATADVKDLLGVLTTTTEIRDSTGSLLGYFTPAVEKEREFLAWASKNIDLAELQRREDSDGPYFTTEQVLAHLQSLGPAG